MDIRLPQSSLMHAPEFVFGVATSSFQIEGDISNRLPSIWDRFCSQSNTIADGSDGAIACDHVRLWRDDVALIADLGVDAYRFSISWPRVMTLDGKINERGVDFYLRLLDGLREAGIRPFVTLYHWDLPQHLEDTGGWLNRDTAFRFQDYADAVTRRFGDRVESYATLNEPFCSAHLGYETGHHAPGIKGRGRRAAHNLLLGHGLGLQALRSNAATATNGIVLNFTPCYPATSTAEDEAAARVADESLNQWYILPLMTGAYPSLIDQLPSDERPDIRDGDMDLISQKLDYLGVNYYTRGIVRADKTTGYADVPPEPPLTDMGWEIYPAGLTDLLVDLNTGYDLPPIIIAENGAAMPDQAVNGHVHDLDRIQYLQGHLEAVHNAMERGVDVRGYFCWSLMDNFEWAEGYRKRFGIYHVDFSTQKRTAKSSAIAYRKLLAGRRQARRSAVS